MTKTLSEALVLEQEDRHSYRWQATEDWMQGRTTFGGLVAGVLTDAMMREVPSDRKLRTLQVTFVGPVGADVSRIETSILRHGSSMTQAEARLYQGDQVCTVVVGGFGAAHEKYLEVESPALPDVPGPDGLNDMPYIPKMLPSFVQHLAIRWTSNTVPFSGSPKPIHQGWCRWREEQPLQLPAMVALLDSWPPPVLSVADRPIRVSSINWLINFFDDLPEGGAPGDAWWLYESHITATHEGFSDCSALLWDAQGKLFARSTQHVIDFVR